MTQKIGIGIEGQLDTAGIERQINTLGQKIAQANKVQFSPVSMKGMSDLDKALKRWEQLLRVHGELNKRMKATGQQGSAPWALDYQSMYPDASVMNRQMQKIFEYTFGQSFKRPNVSPAPPGRPPGGGGGGGDRPHRPGDGSVPGAMAQVTQAGLRAVGPAGGVAANAIGTGMSAGFGAGLMGLLGGMLALGVSKLVGSVMEKVGQAEDNAVAMDRLKRTLGDVNVSFEALKAVVHGGADNLKITYAEAGQLAQQFAKLGNVSNDQYKSLTGELETGVGLSRAYGLDPSQGVGLLGQMRGLGITTSTQESRRFAMLIGETIGKSGAFAKADEVMDAIASFAQSQTRNNMSAANVAGYAGMFSAMVGSGIPGLDPQGAAGLLSRVNASLSAGGAKGEASQFFTAMVGNRLGLDPIQTQILREGGAFATNDSMFGVDANGNQSAYARFFGSSGPSGDKTFLQASLEELRRQYGGNKGLLAQATSNHLGVGINQAMALLSINANQIGEMQDYANLGSLSASGIGNLSKVLYGSSDDRSAIARGLMGREDVSREDKDAIAEAMKKGESTQKEVLAKMTAQYDQERTTGSDIRDSKNALDNIKTNLADKVVPLMNEMRHGIMYLAGNGKKTSQEIMQEVIDRDSEGRGKAIRGRFDSQINPLVDRQDHLDKKLWTLDPERLRQTYRDKPEILAQKLQERADVERELTEVGKKIKALETEREDLLKKENKRRQAEVEKMQQDAERRAVDGLKPEVDYGTAPANQSLSRRRSGWGSRRAGGNVEFRSSGAGAGGAALDTASIDAKLAAAEAANGLPPGTLRAVMEQETGGKQAYLDDPAKYHYGLDANGRRIAPHTGRVSTAFGPFGILESTGRSPGYGVSPLKDKSLDEQIRFAAEYLAARSRSAGSLEGGLAGYGEGAGYSNSVMSRLRRNGTPMPEKIPSSAKGEGGGRFIFDAAPLEIIHRNERGDFLRSERLATNWRPASPFGTEKYA